MSKFACSSCGAQEDFIIKNGMPAPPESWISIELPLIKFLACSDMCCVRLRKQFRAFYGEKSAELNEDAATQIVLAIEAIQRHISSRANPTPKDPSTD